MNKNIGPYHVVELASGRRIWLNTLDLSWPAHIMYGLLEEDVTVARKLLAEHKARTGERLSFAGFLTFCLAHAVDEDKRHPSTTISSTGLQRPALCAGWWS